MQKAWRACEVIFPTGIGEISGCTVSQPDEHTLEITIPDGVVEKALTEIKSLPRSERDAFRIRVRCFTGPSATFESCWLSEYRRGENSGERTQFFSPKRPGKPHIFTFNRTS